MLTSIEHQAIYQKLMLNNTPLIDLRAPVEFAQGAFPSSHNYPLMTDSEREQVGTCYKKHGQDAAIVLGHKLVEHDIKNRINAWAEFKNTNSTAWLYCFRGGMRSQLSTQFLKDIGVDIQIIPGGYKALRRYLIEVIEQAAEQNLSIVSGNTGCGKTQLIQELANGLDIEGRAKHRGSSFGKKVEAQPKQIAYENQLAVDILNIKQKHQSYVIEDESIAIGSIHVPNSLYQAMIQSPVVVIDEPYEIRLQRLQYEYCNLMAKDYQQTLGDAEGWQAYDTYLHRGLFGIRKRLGMERFQSLNRVLDAALLTQQQTGSTDAHLNWIDPILKDYYDPMYQYQLGKKAERIKFTGSYQEVKAYLQNS